MFPYISKWFVKYNSCKIFVPNGGRLFFSQSIMEYCKKVWVYVSTKYIFNLRNSLPKLEITIFSNHLPTCILFFISSLLNCKR